MPRKSDAHSEKDTPASNNSNNSSAASGKDREKEKDNGVSIDDHTLPKSIVTRLAKGVLPQNTNVQKDAILALSKGGTVFVNYLCAAANDQAKQHGRKTINPKDVLEAMEQLEFGEFLPRLEAELAKFNQLAEEKRASTKKSKDKDKPTATAEAKDHEEARDSPPAAKRMRVGNVKGGAVPPPVGVHAAADEDMEAEEEEEEEEGDEEEGDEEEGDEEEGEEEGEEEAEDGDATETESEEGGDEVESGGVEGAGEEEEDDEALDNGDSDSD